MERWLRKIGIIALALLLLLITIGIYLYIELGRWRLNPVALEKPVVMTVDRGSSLQAIAQKLQDNGVIDSAANFQLLVRLGRSFQLFQAGLYQFSDKVTPASVIASLSTGAIYKPIAVEFVIPEGFTMQQIRDRLVARGIGTKASIDRLLTDKSFLRELGVDAPSLEGYLYPATYQFFSSLPSEREALQRMTSEFFKRLPADYLTRASGLGLNLEKAVVFASLIERETLHDEERPLVSEVIWRRLKANEALGIDAALIYGIKDYDGDIKWKDLRNAKNAYNTRIHRGLPPTAIASPSVASLLAVLNPANKGYNYYVRKPGDDNRHQFSRTLEEHNGYVRQWIRHR